jgi:hypothetical protein
LGFVGSSFLGSSFLGSGFLGSGFLGSGFLGSGFLGSGFLGSGLGVVLSFLIPHVPIQVARLLSAHAFSLSPGKNK